jgi:hypothetical protein
MSRAMGCRIDLGVALPTLAPVSFPLEGSWPRDLGRANEGTVTCGGREGSAGLAVGEKVWLYRLPLAGRPAGLSPVCGRRGRRPDLGQEPRSELAGALACRETSALRREEARPQPGTLGEAHQIDRALDGAAHDLRLGHGLRDPAEPAPGAQRSPARPGALEENADTRPRAKLRDGSVERPGVAHGRSGSGPSRRGPWPAAGSSTVKTLLGLGSGAARGRRSQSRSGPTMSRGYRPGGSAPSPADAQGPTPRDDPTRERPASWPPSPHGRRVSPAGRPA